MNEETLKTKLTVEDVYSVRDLTVESGATIEESTYKVGITQESSFEVEEYNNPTTVKILMLKGEPGSGGGSGTTDYNEFINKPQINGVTLSGDKAFEDLNLLRITNTELENMLV